MKQNGVEVYIAKTGSRKGVYVSFPTTREAIHRLFKKAHIPMNNWEVVAVKTGSQLYYRTVVCCRNLDELNLLGFWLSQLDEHEYKAFFTLCEAGCAEGDRMADLINLAANYPNVYCLKNITDEAALGRHCIEMMAKAKPEEADAIRADLAGQEEKLGIDYAEIHHGHIFEDVFCGRRFEWSDVYNEACPETIPEELRLSPTTTKEALGCLPVPGENA